MEQFTNDSGWLVIWQDIKNGGIPLLVFCVLSAFVFLKSYIHSIFSFCGRLIKRKVDPEHKEYTVADVQNHPIFKDLDFWLSFGIKSLRISNVAYHFPMMKQHNDDEDYLKAKENIAKDVLNIKCSVIKEYLELFMKENPIDKIDEYNLKETMMTYLHKCEIKQRVICLDTKLPTIFLKKFFTYEKMSNDLFYQTIDTFLSESAFSGISVASRVYLVFTAINNYLTSTYNNMIYTILSINGDLNGVEYKGEVIGHKKQDILQPPHSSYLAPAREKLKSILSEFSASRVSLIRYYTNTQGDYVHSAVYEVVSPGVSPAITQIQNIPNSMEMDLLELLKNGTVVSVDIDKFNNCLIERLTQRGIDAVIIAPIFIGNDFIGILLLDYLSLEEYNNIKDKPSLDKKLKKHASDVSLYISYPENPIM